MKPARPISIKRRLTLWILAALVTFLIVDTTVIYQNTLQSINVAFDRTLLASARAIGDTVKFENGKLSASLPYATLEVFEAVTRGRIVYRVTDFNGGFLSGYAELPPHDGVFPKRSPYAALAAFYEDRFENESVRVAALLQPVYIGANVGAGAGANGGDGYRMVTVQVAETLELRKSLAQQALISTLDRQLIFLMLLSTLVWWLIDRGMLPISLLRRELLNRDPDSLAPITTPAPRELKPAIEALNEMMARLKRVLDDQQRFVRDASHQLRTPLAVLKLQVQNAQRGDVPPDIAFAELAESVDRATRVANQMLALAKVAQFDAEPAATNMPRPVTNLRALAQDLAVECSPLIADKGLDFALETSGADAAGYHIEGSEWLIRELFRNLLSNAVRHTPRGGAFGIDISAASNDGRNVQMSVWDSGSGIDAAREAKLFEPFSSGDPLTGSGLGLIICRDICKLIGARLTLRNRALDAPGTPGLRATVEFS
jgi:two-component system, OmpR family, sensor histidine kinase TctE